MTHSDTEVLRYAAFTQDPAGGNPAGVVLDATGWPATRMLKTAAGVGYSETAFVTAADPGARAFSLRYFSPLAEVAFCGHATVATSVALAQRHGPGRLRLDTPAGTVTVDTCLADGTGTATLTSVPTRSRLATPAEIADTLDALRWAESDLHPDLPVRVAFAGNEHLMLPARSRARLADLDYDFGRLANVMTTAGWTTVHLFWPQAPGQWQARDPFPVGGVTEDPATGAAAAAFGGYLRDIGLIGQPARITIHQGVDLGRPSELMVEIRPDDRRVRVTGHAVPINA